MFEKLDLWRRHPMLRVTHVKQLFPGFGIAVGIFSVYCVIDWLVKPKHHAVAHGSGAHGSGGSHGGH